MVHHLLVCIHSLNKLCFVTVQGRVFNIAGLRLLSLEGPTCRVGSWLEPENLAFEKFLAFQITLLPAWGTECLLSFWVSGVLIVMILVFVPVTSPQ